MLAPRAYRSTTEVDVVSADLHQQLLAEGQQEAERQLRLEEAAAAVKARAEEERVAKLRREAERIAQELAAAELAASTARAAAIHETPQDLVVQRANEVNEQRVRVELFCRPGHLFARDSVGVFRV